MPWAEQREPEFVEATLKDLETALKYPLDSEYLKDPVWVVRDQTASRVAAVVYDGKFGMYKFKFLTGGDTPKKLEGLFRTKEEIIKKAKEYLSFVPEKETDITTIPFSKESVEQEIAPKEVKEVLKEANTLKGTEELAKKRVVAKKQVEKQVRKNKKQREKEYRQNMFSKVGE